MKTLFAKTHFTPDYAQLTPGTTVRIHQRIQEGNKTRIQVYEGMIIARSGKKTVDATITVRRIGAGNVGIERIFPIFSPNIEKIEIVKRAKKVRRAKLYYLRDKKGDSLKMPEYQIRTEMQIYGEIPEEDPDTTNVEEAIENKTESEKVES